MSTVLRRFTPIAAVAYALAGVALTLAAPVVHAEDWTPLWTTANLSQARFGLSATSVDGQVFFAGGVTANGPSNVVDIYNTSTGTWSTANLSQPRENLAATTVGNDAFFAGGSTGSAESNVVDIYNSATGLWSTAALSQARDQLAAASAGNQAVFAGGMTTGNTTSNAVDIYSVGTGVWSTATLSVARSDLAAASANGMILFGGGITSAQPDVHSSAVDIYNTNTGTWSTTSLTTTQGFLAATAEGSQIFFGGGVSDTAVNGDGDTNVVSIYDTSTGQWTSASLSQPRRRLAAATVGPMVFFAGGYDADAVSTVDIFDSSTDTWSVANLSQPRGQLAAVTAGNQVFFAGGQLPASSGGLPTSTVDIYTLQTYPSITSSKTFTLVDQTTVTGLMQLNAPGSLSLGSFNLVAGSMSGNAPINLQSDSLTVGSDGTSTMYSGGISGNGSLTKTGSGTLTLSGSNSFSGATTVDGGMLVSAGGSNSNSYIANNSAVLEFSSTTVNLGFATVQSNTGGSVQYQNANMTGGFLRGPGQQTTMAGSSNTFNGTTTFGDFVLNQNGNDTLTNFTNGGQIASNGPLAWNGGINRSSGRVTINSIANVQALENDGFLTINLGGTVNNTASDLVIGGGGQLSVNQGGQVNFASGTALDVEGGLLTNNGVISGPTNVYYGALAKGSGIYGPVSVQSGGKFVPGNSPGTANIDGGLTLGAGANLVFEISDATGVAGSSDGWDLANIYGPNGILDFAAGATPNSLLELSIVSGTLENPTMASNFSESDRYHWLLAQTTEGVQGLDASTIGFDTADFLNATGGGSFSLSQVGNDVYLNFTPVPEPSTLLLGAVAMMLAACWRLRRAMLSRTALAKLGSTAC